MRKFDKNSILNPKNLKNERKLQQEKKLSLNLLYFIYKSKIIS